MELLAFLKGEMQRRAWNVARLSEACDVSIGLAAKWVAENPRYRVTPGPASCEKIAAALGVDADYVMELAGHRKTHVTAGTRRLDGELAARLERLQRLVDDGYPRSMLLTVLDANIRMAELGHSDQPVLSFNAEPSISAPVAPLSEGTHGPQGDLSRCSAGKTRELVAGRRN